VALLLSISCFSRTGGRPAGAVKAAWQSVLSVPPGRSAVHHMSGSASPSPVRITVKRTTATRLSRRPASDYHLLSSARQPRIIMLSANVCTPTHRHESITKCLEYADGVTNAGDGARRFVDTLSSVFRPRRPPRPSNV